MLRAGARHAHQPCRLVAAGAGATPTAPLLSQIPRSFHNFNVLFRGDDSAECVGFTAAQIPNIDGRRYPPELSGAPAAAGARVSCRSLALQHTRIYTIHLISRLLPAAGPLYPEGLPIWPEEQLEKVVAEQRVRGARGARFEACWHTALLAPACALAPDS